MEAATQAILTNAFETPFPPLVDINSGSVTETCIEERKTFALQLTAAVNETILDSIAMEWNTHVSELPESLSKAVISSSEGESKFEKLSCRIDIGNEKPSGSNNQPTSHSILWRRGPGFD